MSDEPVCDDGDLVTQVVLAKTPGARWLKPTTLVLVIATVFCVIFSLAVTLAFIAPTIDRLTRNETGARDEREVLIAQVGQLEDDARGARALAACRALFSDDIRAATGRSQLALSDLFVAAVNADPGRSAEERQAANAVLTAALSAENEPLRLALAEYDAYTQTDPPPDVCPHPQYRPETP